MRNFQTIFPLILLISVVQLTGCVTDNRLLTKTPFFKARSDYIPGVLIPKDRVALIREKGEKGKNLPETEKREILGQLTEEYLHSPDPNVRYESVRSIALLNMPEGFAVVKTATHDGVPFVRMAACDALARLETPETAHTLRYLLAHDDDQDVRTRAAKNLAVYTNDQETVQALGRALDDKTLAVQFESMQSLKKVSGQDYGNDLLRWKQYVAGESPTPAAKRSLAERLMINQLPMF